MIPAGAARGLAFRAVDRTTRARLVAAGTVSLTGLLLLGACGGGSSGGTASPTSVVDSTAFRTIPVTAPPTTAAPAPAETSATGDASSGGGQSSGASAGGVQGNTYVVVANDYWYGIADKLGVDAQTLAGYNDMNLDTALFVGMQLRIPPAGATGGGATSGSSGSSGSNSTQAPADSGYYIAVENDFWPAIAAKLGVDLDDLLQANGATMETTVFVGQRIKIPS